MLWKSCREFHYEKLSHSIAVSIVTSFWDIQLVWMYIYNIKISIHGSCRQLHLKKLSHSIAVAIFNSLSNKWKKCYDSSPGKKAENYLVPWKSLLDHQRNHRIITLINNALVTRWKKRSFLTKLLVIEKNEYKQFCTKFCALSRGAIVFDVSLLVYALRAAKYSVTLLWPFWQE